MYKMSFLNDNICKEVRRIINSSKIFYRDPKEKDNYSLICAVLNRIDDSVNFLNSNDDKLSKDNDIILFIVHACMVVDAVKIMMKNLNMNPDDYDEVNYFKSVCMSDALRVKETECIKDSKFFEYFRSLVFAHPVDTSRAEFLKKQNEIHYSPFLLSEHNSMRKNSIGIMIYSSKTPDVKLLYVPHNAIFNYEIWLLPYHFIDGSARCAYVIVGTRQPLGCGILIILQIGEVDIDPSLHKFKSFYTIVRARIVYDREVKSACARLVDSQGYRG